MFMAFIYDILRGIAEIASGRMPWERITQGEVWARKFSVWFSAGRGGWEVSAVAAVVAEAALDSSESLNVGLNLLWE